MILAPFTWIVALFFNASHALFGDPGWAVVGLSVLLSLLLTPLYVWIERRKTSDRARYAPMQTEIDKIDAVYSGRERYYYTREIQRRHRYRPWVALVPTLGLLVQIPFLLAAYHYLSELPIFAGVSFGYIRDLSRPDTVAVVAGLPVNLLAIVMTVINLASGWRYAESGRPKDRFQYALVAFAFLFLLYRCAASVVLYWTLSNALSLVRNEIFFRKRGVGMPVRRPSGFTAPLRFGLQVSFAAIAVLAADAAWLAMWGGPGGRAQTWKLSVCGAALLLLALGCVAGLRRRRTREASSDAVGCRTGDCRRLRWLGAGALVSLAIQVFLCAPVCVFASCPDVTINVTLAQLFTVGGIATMGVIVASASVFCLLPDRFVRAATGCVLLAVGGCFVYGNLVSVDYGVLYQGNYSRPQGLTPTTWEFCFEAVAIGLALTAIRRTVPRYWEHAGKIWLALALVTGSYFVRMAMAIRQLPSPTVSVDGEVADRGGLFRFSRSEKNVVLVFLDSFMGQSFGKLIESDPTLRKAFDGFTWYPLTISASWFTFPNMCAMIGGEEYFPARVRNRRLGEVFPEAWKIYRRKVQDCGCRMASTATFKPFMADYAGVERMFDELNYRSAEDAFLSPNLRSLIGNSVLRSLPFVFRPSLYDDGRWHHSSRRTALDSPFHFMRDLVRNSEIAEIGQGLYVHIHSETTHYPFETPTEEGRRRLGVASCYRWSLRRFAEWLEWMRQKGIYDKTRIVLASDHGISDLTGMELDGRFVRNVDRMRAAADSSAGACPYFSLLVTKDFNERGDLRTNLTTKTVSHAAYFALGDPRFAEPVVEIVTSDVIPPCPPDWYEKVGFDIRRNVKITGSAGDGANWSGF